MEPLRFDFGEEVRVIRNIRNDGTFPGQATGTLLVRRGSAGIVRDVGTFLQDQVIYTVHFLAEDRVVGCRDGELIGLDEPWIETRFEFGDKVVATISLGVRGEILAERGGAGEVIKVLRDWPGGPAYRVRFPGRTLLVPETALCAAAEASPKEALEV